MPRNRFQRLAEVMVPWCMAARGVAEVTMSAVEKMPAAFSKPTFTQLLMTTGQLNRKARAARAGFTKFLPMPPNSCFTTIMAKKSPIRIHQ